MWLGSRQQLAKIDTKTMTICEHRIESSTSDKNLGVTFDSELGMDLHVNNITRSYFYQLRQPRSIRRSLSKDATKALVHSLISSRVDYCSSIFLRCHETLLWDDFNLSSTRLPGWSQTRGSSTISLLCWGTNSTGFPFVSGSNSRSRSLSATLSMVEVRLTSAAPAIPFQEIDDRAHLRSAVRGDLTVPWTKTVASGLEVPVSPDRLFGTHCPKTFEFRNCHWNVSNPCWKHIYFAMHMP